MSFKFPQEAREIAKRLVRTYFKNDYGKPFELVDGQADIFLLIFLRYVPRSQVIALTQYGKSDTVAMALILRSESHHEPWAILSGDKDKAMIIMGKVIQHIFDHPRFYKAIEYDPDFPLDRLRRERSKEKIDWRGGGGIQIFTANAKNRNAIKDALTGKGAPNIVEDEASLIPDQIQAMVLRMLGGHADNFLLKIGNPFYRNQFLRSWESDKYLKIFIDYHQALAEGRVTEEFIEEMRKEPFFDVLYECKFPSADEFMTGGYRQLISRELLEKAFISYEEAKPLMVGQPKLGGDFAGAGRDRNAYVLRYPKVMMLLSTNDIADTMQQVPIIEGYIEKYEIEDTDVAVDYGGLGQGIGDRLHEKDFLVNLVMFGSSAPELEKDKYKNMRAYMYYKLKQWLEEGGRIVRNDGFLELLSVNYKEDSERKFQIQPKEELKKIMKQMGIIATSPDVADGGVLTFADNTELIDEDDVELI